MFARRPAVSVLSLLTLSATLAACGGPTEPGEDEIGDGTDDGIILDDGEEADETGEPDLPGEDGETDEGEEPPTCETTTAITATEPPNVVLVLDKSRSMVLNSWDDDGDAQTPDVTRWYSLHGTVDAIAGQYEAGMHLGLTLFPSNDATSELDEACLVNGEPEVGVGLDNAAAVLAAIPDADSMELYGATPAAAGISTALAHLEALDDGRPAAMILVTDGAANCDPELGNPHTFAEYDENLPLVVEDAWERAGIPTYVVGIDIVEDSQYPFTNPREKLDEVAHLGGVPQDGEVGFFDASNAQGLMTALDAIASSVSCGVELGKAPSGPDQLVVTVAGETLEQLASCDEGEGWIYTSEDLTHIELCNASCDAMLETGEIEAEFLCPPQP